MAVLTPLPSTEEPIASGNGKVMPKWRAWLQRYAELLGTIAGGQIPFPATQNPSTDPNTLDDYERGTFTPTFVAAGATFSYATQAGTYTKVGQLVSFNCAIKLNASGNTLAAAALSISGLPFANGTVAVVFPIAWFQSTTSYVNMFGNFDPAATTVTVRGSTAAGVSIFNSINADAALHATNGSEYRFSGCYSV